MEVRGTSGFFVSVFVKDGVEAIFTIGLHVPVTPFMVLSLFSLSYDFSCISQSLCLLTFFIQ